MDNILEVKNLRVSFRTSGGTVKAVRDISFNLKRGETLAIVGESGSGKSVTSKAILGILAGNSIIEGGKIIYDGRDLLKIGEDEMYRLRGDKISMIFQDPLSSLNPIVKIGKQITEAMLLKNKASRRDARNEFNSMLKTLEKAMAEESGDAENAKQLCKTFDDFCIKANELENSYNNDDTVALAVLDELEDLAFAFSKKQKLDASSRLGNAVSKMKSLRDPFYTAHFTSELSAVESEIGKTKGQYNKEEGTATDALTQAVDKAIALMKSMTEQPRPDFFRIGYYVLKNPNEKLYGRDVAELNEMALHYLNDNFMTNFVAQEQKAVEYAHKISDEKKAATYPALDEAIAYFSGTFTKKEALAKAKELADRVEGNINHLKVVKDSAAYTLRTTLVNDINRYFSAKVTNPKEEKRFAKQSARREALIAKGKTVDWKVVPKVIYDLDELQADMVTAVRDVKHNYEVGVGRTGIDFHARSIEIVDFLKEKASRVVYKVTRSMAKERAIKLMDEVGISEPRMRYYQYPFEFSGGMRQRIVIAIALAANPEILICDEPTTALDVTIQAQILELINKLKAERHLSVIFITHDLGVVANMADDIAVMYAGKIVEYGTADDIFYDPRHPYTWALLSSMPDLDTKEKLDAIPGTPPNMIYPPVGDAFAARNKYAMAIDFEQQPPMFPVSETHSAATWLLHPDAPKVEVPKLITDRIERMKKKAGEQNG